jgi:acetyl-CoA carboxylase carboxyltransferase component
MSDLFKNFQQRKNKTHDQARPDAVSKRHSKGFRTARENLEDLVELESFIEYGQMAVAAQRNRYDNEELIKQTPADGIITGLALINADLFDNTATQTAVIVNDYSVLAGTQGYFHHKKLDRILEIATEKELPIVMYTEGGGGRPGDTDVTTQIAGLNLTSFAAWAGLQGKVPRIAVNNGYCFAGNAALFGCADISIATRQSWIGMAGPAMIEGGGLGTFKATEIGPIEIQSKNGVVDIVADDETEATHLVKKVLSYFQGTLTDWDCTDQSEIGALLPQDRRFVYDVRKIIETLADKNSFIELQKFYAPGIINGFIRIAGKAFGLICNDCKILGGAIDAAAASKTANFIRLCDSFNLPIVSLCDTPGFMVGPESETHGAVSKTADLFIAGASCKVPFVTIFLRKAYGLGAMAMAGGSFAKPLYSASWPTGEFGAMGLEGAVRLGYKKELSGVTDPEERQKLFESLLAEAYHKGQAIEAAAYLEIDAVIDPVTTRDVILQCLG